MVLEMVCWIWKKYSHTNTLMKHEFWDMPELQDAAYMDVQWPFVVTAENLFKIHVCGANMEHIN